jgi:hypothetical protein
VVVVTAVVVVTVVEIVVVATAVETVVVATAVEIAVASIAIIDSYHQKIKKLTSLKSAFFIPSI